MKSFDSLALQSTLEEELDAGAKIVEGTAYPNWGAMTRLIVLDAPFRTFSWKDRSELTFRDIDDPRYWKTEIEDPTTRELLACRF